MFDQVFRKLHLSRFFGINKIQLFLAFFSLLFLLTFIPVYTYAYYSEDLITRERLINKNDQGIILLDSKGEVFFTFYNGKNKTTIPLSEIPEITRLSVIAAEDREFYYHPGFSLKAIVRSVALNIEARDLSYGGSTLTQQLVKNALLTPKKDLLRKYQEIVLATEVEKRFDKGQILEMYLNSVYFGEGSFGIEEASRVYFKKSAKDLSLAESAFLAGILKSPSRVASGDNDWANTRQKYVLEAMVGEGFITEVQKDEAIKTELKFAGKEDNINYQAPHFALMVKDELEKKYGKEIVEKSGFRVKTSINLEWQKYAEKVISDQVAKLAANRVSNAAVVVADPNTGHIKALVGSRDWNNNNYGKTNIALFPRSPGSSFKPIVYLAALEQGLITPSTILKDQPTSFKNDPNTHNVSLAYYKPQNYDLQFRGDVTARRALANSLNIPSVEVLSKLGVDKTLEMAQRLGITTLQDPKNYGLSLVLGTGEVPLLEMTQAYQVLANEGFKNDLTTILEITDKEGNIIYAHTPKQQPVVDSKYTFLISSMLSDSKARSEIFGNVLNISRVAAVKTGTSQSYKDSWTMGYTPSLVIGSWMGNNSGIEMAQVAGSLGAAPIWKALMEEFLKGQPSENFEIPTGVITRSVCPWNGLPIREATSSGAIEYFIQGTEPRVFCTIPKPEDKQDQPGGQQAVI